MELIPSFLLICLMTSSLASFAAPNSRVRYSEQQARAFSTSNVESNQSVLEQERALHDSNTSLGIQTQTKSEPQSMRMLADQIILAVDGSDSIRENDFFGPVLDFVEAFYNVTRSNTKLGLIVFNAQIKLVIPLNIYSKQTWTEMVMRLRNSRSGKSAVCCSFGTPVAEAFDLAYSAFTNATNPIVFESSIKRYVLMISDGRPRQRRPQEIRRRRYMYEIVPMAANRLRAISEIFHIGIPNERGQSSDYFGSTVTEIQQQGCPENRDEICRQLNSQSFPLVSKPRNQTSVVFRNAYKQLNIENVCDMIPRICTRYLLEATVSPTTTPILSPISAKTSSPTSSPMPPSTSPADFPSEQSDIPVQQPTVFPNPPPITIVTFPPLPRVVGNETYNQTGIIDENVNGQSGLGMGVSTVVAVVIATFILTSIATTSLSSTTVSFASTSTIGEALAPITVFECLSYCHHVAAGAQMSFPEGSRAVEEYTTYAKSLAWTTMVFLPLGEVSTSNSTVLLQMRSLSASEERRSSNVDDAMARFAISVGIAPEFLCASVLLVTVLLVAIALILYALGTYIKACLERNNGIRKREVKVDICRITKTVLKETLIQLGYYMIYPIATVFSYQLYLGSQKENLMDLNETAIVAFTVIVAALIVVFLLCFYHMVKNTYAFPENLFRKEDELVRNFYEETEDIMIEKECKHEVPAETSDNRKIETPILYGEINTSDRNDFFAIQDIKTLGKTESSSSIKESVDQSESTRNIEKFRAYRCLVLDWKYEARMFWVARVLVSIARGLILGLIVSGVPRPIQPLLLVGISSLYAVTLWLIQPYRLRIQNTVAFCVALLYVFSTIILVFFALDPPLCTEETALGLSKLQTAITIFCILGTGLVVLLKYCGFLQKFIAKRWNTWKIVKTQLFR